MITMKMSFSNFLGDAFFCRRNGIHRHPTILPPFTATEIQLYWTVLAAIPLSSSTRELQKIQTRSAVHPAADGSSCRGRVPADARAT
jgi:hypothetical protein